MMAPKAERDEKITERIENKGFWLSLDKKNAAVKLRIEEGIEKTMEIRNPIMKRTRRTARTFHH
jgi:hypothetical protein